MKNVTLHYKHPGVDAEGILIETVEDFWEVYHAYKINCVPQNVLDRLAKGERIVVNSKGGWTNECEQVSVKTLTKLNVALLDGLIDELRDLVNSPKLEQLDFSDLGNAIGATIGGEGITKADKESLAYGLKHGFSIADGTH